MTARLWLAAAAAIALPAAALAQETSHETSKDDAKPAASTPAGYAPLSATKRFAGTFGERSVNYSTTVTEQVLKDDKGKPKAAIVTTAYIAEPRDPGRPVTFLFNGGPGSGSVWLQMGAFGPKRVAIPSDARDDGAPPYPILDNPDSLLDVTDLVFIDPVGTGFSHTIGDTKGEEYWGVTKDAKSVAAVIRKWLDGNGRWNSPKFLGGESYGTTRSAAVAHELEVHYNDVALNGIILISTILDFAAGETEQGDELGYITNLPSMATTAFYHHKASAASAEAIAQEARQFAIGPYASFLLKGQNASAEERTAVRGELARLTGLSGAYLDQAELRVSPGRFFKELLRDQGLTVGRLDSRYTGKDYDNAGEYPDNDPSFYGIDGGYTAAINSFMRDTVGFRTDQRYITIGSVQPWDWTLGEGGGGGRSPYLSVAPYIGQALRENSGLRVFVGQGWYDFATPFFGAEYALSRTGIPQDRIQYHYYDAGHMMYVRDEDRHKLAADVRAFIRGR